MGKIKVTQTRSVIGTPEKHRRILKALGLRRINHTVEHENTPTIRGMVKKVIHMVRFEEVA
ncbi:MAG: 50S ribosomal protein L30 [Deltaproteobacteria bacterium]|nr:50S ribosomal protein L30 [bacterium]MCB9477358.1 50S ribosomal protein L30 [Deltaproteobacteria bacterium]MCB9479006.1 50S ribosomal protein L30 [Deltaproteobacteria bacterium]MCB9487786.1 50S ribosomal protein L30 [Deltaproteobacteria bacterium]